MTLEPFGAPMLGQVAGGQAGEGLLLAPGHVGAIEDTGLGAREGITQTALAEKGGGAVGRESKTVGGCQHGDGRVEAATGGEAAETSERPIEQAGTLPADLLLERGILLAGRQGWQGNERGAAVEAGKARI